VIGYVVATSCASRYAARSGRPVIDAALAKGRHRSLARVLLLERRTRRRRRSRCDRKARGDRRGDGARAGRCLGQCSSCRRPRSPPAAVSRRRDDGQVSGATRSSPGADPPRRGYRALAVRAESMTTSTASMPLAFRPERGCNGHGSEVHFPAPPCSARRPTITTAIGRLDSFVATRSRRPATPSTLAA